jgi:tetratricopeptide (TPR) repeat protein
MHGRQSASLALAALMALAVFSTMANADDAGVCADQSGDVAIAACSRAIKSGRHRGHALAAAYNNRCSEYLDKEEFDLAIADCLAAIKADKAYAMPHQNLGLIYYKRSNYDRTIEETSAAIRLDAKYAKAYGTRASAYSLKGDHDRAIADYNVALQLDPKSPISFANRCDELAMLRQYRAALKDCDESLRIRPHHQNTTRHRAIVYLALDDIDAASRDFADLLEMDSKDPIALYGRGMVKLRKGDAAGGRDDMALAEGLRDSVAEAFTSYGITADARK